MTSVPPYCNLVIEGGGVLGIAYMGALRVLRKHHDLRHITRFAGSSIGAMTVGLLACRMDLETLEKIVTDLDYRELGDRTWCLADTHRIVTQYGLYKGDKLFEWYGNLLAQQTGHADITLKQVYQMYNSYVVITGTNLTRQRVVYFTPETHPNMPLRLAARISASVPFMFRRVIFEGDVYIDGGLIDNFPVNYFDSPPDEANQETLGIKLIADAEITEQYKSIDNLIDFSYGLFCLFYQQALKTHVDSHHWPRCVKIHTGNVNSLDLSLDLTTKKWLIKQGEDAMTDFLAQRYQLPSSSIEDSSLPPTEEVNDS